MRFKESNDSTMYSNFQRIGRIRKCFCCGTEDNIISSHSISMKKCLALLAENVNGQSGVYSFKDITWSNEHYYDTFGFGYFNIVGISKASTFKGFCSTHDQKIFKLIDENTFNPQSLEQCFLYCYRAFAHSFHAKNEEVKRCRLESEYKQRNLTAIKIDGAVSDLCVTVDIGEYPNKMNKWLVSKDYTNMYHFHIEMRKFHHIAVAGVCEPPYTINNCKINDYLDFSTPLNHVFINIIPEYNSTHILISAFKDQPKSIRFIKEIADTYKSDTEKVYRFLTSILIFHIENTFVSPSLINSLTDSERRNLLLNLKLEIQKELYSRFVLGSLNLFKNQ